MTIYNTFLHIDSGVNVFTAIEPVTFVVIFFVALAIDWFIAAPLVKGIVRKVSNEKTSFIQMVMMISCLMVLFMCTAMSLVATLIQGYEGSLLAAYGHNFILNIIVALPLQILLAGPVARAIFFRIFPLPVQPQAMQV
ncbi:DUF2798 domain-containing protein [Shewanella sp. UCD-KL21]|uniref:DUF2798 domain-containing protein n=1 Tax=Shewanella sp. UCD-KL21 TaxID=1917164 RepID=UPI00158B4F15|nr:DUF2798 domain-containing protein [Shewanella sp. UCD-KL21]